MRAKVPPEIRWQIERWYAARLELGTMKKLAKQLNIPKHSIANVCQRMRQREEV
jgi:hypothetical protein